MLGRYSLAVCRRNDRPEHHGNGTDEGVLLRQERIVRPLRNPPDSFGFLRNPPALDHDLPGCTFSGIYPGNNPSGSGNGGSGLYPHRHLSRVAEPAGQKGGRLPEDLVGIAAAFDRAGDCGEGAEFPRLPAGFVPAGDVEIDPRPEDDPARGVPDRDSPARDGAILSIGAQNAIVAPPRNTGIATALPPGAHRLGVPRMEVARPHGIVAVFEHRLPESRRHAVGPADPDPAWDCLVGRQIPFFRGGRGEV